MVPASGNAISTDIALAPAACTTELAAKTANKPIIEKRRNRRMDIV